MVDLLFDFSEFVRIVMVEDVKFHSEILSHGRAWRKFNIAHPYARSRSGCARLLKFDSDDTRAENLEILLPACLPVSVNVHEFPWPALQEL